MPNAGRDVDVEAVLRAPDLARSAAEREEDLLEAIRRVFVEIETKERDLYLLIEEAQRQGVSWRKIGRVQGAMSPQAAQQRAARYAKRSRAADHGEQGVDRS